MPACPDRVGGAWRLRRVIGLRLQRPDSQKSGHADADTFWSNRENGGIRQFDVVCNQEVVDDASHLGGTEACEADVAGMRHAFENGQFAEIFIQGDENAAFQIG